VKVSGAVRADRLDERDGRGGRALRVGGGGRIEQRRLPLGGAPPSRAAPTGMAPGPGRSRAKKAIGGLVGPGPSRRAVAKLGASPRPPAVDGHGQVQPGVRQVEPVHDLVVVVAGRRVGVAGEGVRVRPLEVDHPAAVPVEHRVLLGVVEAVPLVRGHLAGVDPRPQGRVGLGEPDLAQQRGPPISTAIITQRPR
jgi:hypothetical protein